MRLVRKAALLALPKPRKCEEQCGKFAHHYNVTFCAHLCLKCEQRLHDEWYRAEWMDE